MRVLVIHSRHREPGGEDAVVHHEVELLRAAQHEVLLHEVANPAGARSAAAVARAPWDAAGASVVADLAQRFRPDVAHVHNTWYALSPALLPALSAEGVPVVATLHNYRLLCADGTLFRDGVVCLDCVGRGPWRAVRYGCYRDSRSLSVVAAATISVARRRSAWTGVRQFVAPSSTVKALHVAGGFDAASITVKPHSVADPGPRSNAPSTSNTVVAAGRIAHGKGFDTLLDAWSRAELDGLRLVILGDGPLRRELEARGVANVEFAGFMPRETVQQHLGDARAFAFPSTWLEPFGLVVLEAMAAGTPVLGCDTADVAALAGAGGAFGLPTTAGLADALRSAADDSAVDKLGAAGRERYLESFTPAANLQQLLAIYESAINRGDA